MTAAVLPREFADLQPSVEWCIADEGARYEKRLATPMAQLQAFYDAAAPRAEQALNYCDQFPLNAMPAEATALLHLLYSFVTVSFAVECWGQAHVPDTGATRLDLLVAPGP